MKKHELILASIFNNNWAITEPGIATILAIANQGSDAIEMRETFESLKVSQQDEFTSSGKSSYKENVATLDISGPIFPKSNLMTNYSGATSLQMFMKDFMAAEADSEISDIVLYFDSPGGVVTGIAEAGDLIANSSKNITAYVTGSAASAAYWLASQADKIVMSPTGLVGSIGIVTSRYKKSEEDKEIEFVSSQSPKKRLNPDSKEGATAIVAELDQIAEVFISTVAEGRNVLEDTVLKDFGQGGNLIGQYAVDAGMADSVSTYEELLAELTNNNNNDLEGGSQMPDVKDLTASDVEKGNPTLYKSIVESGRVAGSAEGSETLTALQEENKDLKSKLEKSDENATAMGDRMKTLEKKDAKREIQGIQATADSIVSAKLAASDVPEAFHGKVKGYISHADHIVEGSLDKEAFSASVDAEIADWSEGFTTASTHGFSVADKDNEDTDTTAVDDSTDRMLAHCGVGGDK